MRGTTTVEVPAPQEILTDNAQLMLEGLLWEIDQRLNVLDDDTLVATLAAQAEALLDRLSDRARTAARSAIFGDVTYRIEADDLSLNGFTPALRTTGRPLVMQFKAPHEVVGNHIAKHQALKLSLIHI